MDVISSKNSRTHAWGLPEAPTQAPDANNIYGRGYETTTMGLSNIC